MISRPSPSVSAQASQLARKGAPLNAARTDTPRNPEPTEQTAAIKAKRVR